VQGQGIAVVGRVLGERVLRGRDALVLDETVEAILARGAAWCTDVARVAGVLVRAARWPVRLVYLAETR
jgi:hypothetical protein